MMENLALMRIKVPLNNIFIFYKPAVTNDVDVVGFLHTHTLRCREEGCLCMSLFPACVDRWMYLLLK